MSTLVSHVILVLIKIKSLKVWTRKARWESTFRAHSHSAELFRTEPNCAWVRMKMKIMFTDSLQWKTHKRKWLQHCWLCGLLGCICSDTVIWIPYARQQLGRGTMTSFVSHVYVASPSLCSCVSSNTIYPRPAVPGPRKCTKLENSTKHSHQSIKLANVAQICFSTVHVAKCEFALKSF